MSLDFRATYFLCIFIVLRYVNGVFRSLASTETKKAPYRGKTLTWTRGRKLISYGDVQFVYDAQGKRISKNSTQYYYNSSEKLIAAAMVWNTSMITWE